MRISGGSLRGRPIAAPPGRNIRPSGDRLRDALFNILAHSKCDAIPPLDGARILDAFAGTGALGLEALSRGAGFAAFIDRDLTWVRRNIESLGQADRAKSITADATTPPPTKAPVDIAFLDPPYREGLAPPSLRALADAGWLGPRTLTVVETSAKESTAWPPGFKLLQTRRYGAAQITLLTLSQD